MLKRFGLGFGLGYLLGARAGQQRYEQLADAGRRLAEAPVLRDVVERGPQGTRDAARRLLDAARQRIEPLLASGDDGQPYDDAGGDDAGGDDETVDDETGDDETGDDVTGDDDDETGDDDDHGTRDEPAGGRAGWSPRHSRDVRKASPEGGRGRQGADRRSLASSLAGVAAGVIDRGRVA